MKQNFYILILIFLFLLLKCSKTKETVISISNSNRKLNNQVNIEKNCCKVTKKINDNKDSFIYDFERLNECNTDEIYNDNSSQIFIDGVNNWKDEYCSSNNNIVGSCKNINFECKDFSLPNQCEKYNMEYFPETCFSTYDKQFKIIPHNLPTAEK